MDGDTLLTLFPKTQVGSMWFKTWNTTRNVALEMTYNGEIYNTPKQVVRYHHKVRLAELQSV